MPEIFALMRWHDFRFTTNCESRPFSHEEKK